MTRTTSVRQVYRHFLGIITILTILGATLPGWGQERVINLTTVNWAPYYAAHLPEDGFFSEIVKSAFERAGYKPVLAFRPWKRSMVMVENGEADVLMGAYYNDERAKVYWYSDTIYLDRVVLIARKDLGIKSYQSLRDLAPYQIAIGRGWTYSEEFDNADYLQKQSATDQVVNIRKLKFGRVDLFAASETVFRYEVANHQSFSMDRFVVLEPPLKESALFLAVSRAIPDGKQITNDFNLALKAMKEDGTFRQILKKHGML